MSAEVVALPIVLLASSTILLGIVLIIARALGRRSAEERHLIVAVAVLALLVLPAAVLGLPKVRLSLSMPGLEAGLGAAAAVVSSPRGRQAGARASTEDGGAQPAQADASRSDSAAASAAAAGLERRAARLGRDGRLDVAVLAAGGYFGVVALLVLGFMAGLGRVGRRVRRLPEVSDPETLRLAAGIARELGLCRRLRLRASDTDHTPWAWGVVRPTIVLPATFRAWSAQDRRNALVHECAHIRRLDPLSMTLARICAALYWPQPLVWLAVRRLRRDAERACDDRVVLSGADESAYAEQLLGIARAVYADGLKPSLAPAMACTSLVSERINSILDTRTRRTTVTRLKTTFAITAMLLVVTPFATLRGQDPNVPSSEADLERIVEGHVAEGNHAAAEAVLVSWIAGDYEDATGSCHICAVGLRGRDDEQGGLRGVVLDAFDAVEASASEAEDASLFMRLARIVADAGTSDTLELGMHYVVQGRLLGSDSDEDRFVVMRYLLEMGEHDAARQIVEAIHNDSTSRLYQSETTEQWLGYIESRQARNELLATTLGTVGGGTAATTEYVPLRKVAPDYPEPAREQRREGYVILEYTLMPSGHVSDARVIESSDELFEEAALASVEQYRFAPRLDGGAPIEVPGVQTIIRFALEQ